MSQYDALTGVKRLRVRRYKAVRYCATLKAAGLNILRAAAVAMGRKRAKDPAKGQIEPFFIPFPFVKERIYRIFSGLEKILLPTIARDDFYFKSAA